MAAIPDVGARPGWVERLAGSRAFQSFAARVPGLAWVARREGAAIFDLMQGFARTQVLRALVELRVLDALAQGPRRAEDLAPGAGMTIEAMALLLQAGAGIGLVKRQGQAFRLTRRGAAFRGVPGLSGLVRHHAVLYRDLDDPVAFLRGETEPELAQFWPYVFGAGAAADPGTAAVYSRLMAETQVLVAEDVLRLADFSGARRLMDVGGGTGAFLAAVAAAHPDLDLTLFDLGAVVSGARMLPRLTVVPGSFRDDPLPMGADMISLIRVLYDHADDTVAALLAKVHAALPARGRLIVAEPMSGGARPDPATDVYFALYCRAMRTGRVRSAAEIGRLLAAAGFAGISRGRSRRPFVTSVVTAEKP
jgi:demethylspheroidene O-methyltransferase